jgi:hypothetical protein
MSVGVRISREAMIPLAATMERWSVEAGRRVGLGLTGWPESLCQPEESDF